MLTGKNREDCLRLICKVACMEVVTGEIVSNDLIMEAREVLSHVEYDEYKQYLTRRQRSIGERA